MKLLVSFLALISFFTIKIAALETDYYKILSICYYYDDLDDTANFKSCINCVDSACPSKNLVTNEESKKCTSKFPEKFATCGTQSDTKTCLLKQLQTYRQESQEIFRKNHKDTLNRRENTRLSQVWSAFFMYVSMAKELTQKTTNKVIETTKICFDPIKTDLSKYDEPTTEALEGSRDVRQIKDSDSKIVKNTYKRVYRLYLCCIKQIENNKEAKSIVLEFMPTYHGMVPAKIARLNCGKKI